MSYEKKISTDGTIRLDYSEGYSAVVIPSINDKYAVCVSSQVGCPVGCVFCYSPKFKRNLSKEEILEQISDACKEINQPAPTSVVFMGTGEPMLNSDNVLETVDDINRIYSLSYKRITLSTCGINLHLLKDAKFHIAISWHSMFGDVREKLIPLSEPHYKILSFINEFCRNHRHGILLEYSMMKDVNDTDTDLKAMSRYRWPQNVNFNLIEYNDKPPFKKSDRLEEFKDAIMAAGYKCFIRESRGSDIGAACGMLTTEEFDASDNNQEV